MDPYSVDNITDIRIERAITDDPKFRAYASVMLGESLIIRDLKVIQAGDGLFLAMPSRKLTDRCPHCKGKNVLRQRFCGSCGHRLDDDRGVRDKDGRIKLYADTVHPCCPEYRELLQEEVIRAYHDQLSLT